MLDLKQIKLLSDWEKGLFIKDVKTQNILMELLVSQKYVNFALGLQSASQGVAGCLPSEIIPSELIRTIPA